MNSTQSVPQPERLLQALRDARVRLEALEQRERRASEPIAVCGFACRFPGGANDPESFWQVLSNGVDAVSDVPSDRWDADAYYDARLGIAGKARTRKGGFLDQVDRFDAEFFGISPREAALLDPQQRLLLEVAWEAFERSAWIPDRAYGSQVGVFLGMATDDYADLVKRSGRLGEESGLFAMTGVSNYAAAGRLAYFFGLTGPALVLDTACSSSLVAVHYAVQSLRRGESCAALAGGVNVMLAPEATVALSQGQMLALDGRSKAFDAAADGMVRAEGCGLVLLKRLSDAVADHDPIYAVIRGSAVNQDGARGAFTVPNGRMQEAVIRQALSDAHAEPGDIAYVEAHGTGTALGDPIEVAALGRVLGDRRTCEDPLWIGSVKTNVGHLEAAAGMAGLIKTILCLQNKQIPPSIHFETPNPRIDWDGLPIRVAATTTPWPAHRSLAAVSSFGASGTNANVVIEGAPPDGLSDLCSSVRRDHVLVLSARNETALRELASRYAEYCASTTSDLADVCWSAYAGRAHFAHRLAVVGSEPEELRQRLAHFLDGQPDPGVFVGSVTRREPPATVAELRTPAERAHAWVTGATDSVGQSVGSKRRVMLPTYPWQRSRHWISARRDALPTHLPSPPRHPLVGSRTDLDGSAEVQFQTVLEPESMPGISAHRLGSSGPLVFPGSGFYEAALAAGHALLGGGVIELREVEIKRALVLSNATRLRLQTVIRTSGGVRRFEISTQPLDGEAWTLHASGELGYLGEPVHDSQQSPGDVVEEWIEVPEFDGLLLPPDALDAALRLIGDTVEVPAGEVVAQVGVSRLRWYGPATSRTLARVRHLRVVPETRDDLVNVILVDAAARPLLDVERLRLRRLRTETVLELARADWADWLYEIEWHPAAIFGANPLRSPVDAGLITGPLDASWANWPELDALPGYQAATEALETIATAYLVHAFVMLGWRLGPGDSADAETLVRDLGIARQHRRLFVRCLDILTRAGWLEQDGENWRAVCELRSTPVEGARAHLLEAHPEASAEMGLVTRCGEHLADVLQGRRSAVELLFPDGDVGEAVRLYADSPGSRVMNRLVAETLGRILAGLPEWNGIRVLEIGAGTGGTTAAVLPQLDGSRTQYCFTDVSLVFLNKARERLREFEQLTFELLDIEEDLNSQGFGGRAFDVVIATNVLHATRDLRATLRNVRRLLAPGGVLLLVEGDARLAWIDLTFGLTEGWWRFMDVEIRRDYPLIGPDIWARLLAETGFKAPSAVVPRRAEAAVASSLMVAWAPCETGAPQRLLLGGSTGIDGVKVRRGPGYRRLNEAEYEIDPFTPGDYRQLLEDASLHNHIDQVVHLWSLDAANGDDSTESVLSACELACRTALVTVQALLELPEPKPSLMFVTRGGQAASDDDALVPPAATLWGLARSVALECPELRCQIVDLDAAATASEDATTLKAGLQFAGRDSIGHSAFRRGRRLAPRIRRASVSESEALRMGADESVIVTGGLHGIGLYTAEWLVAHGARHLMLIGHSEPEALAASRIEALRARGVDIAIELVDVAREPDLRAAIARATSAEAQVVGVIHSAGTFQDALIREHRWDFFTSVFAAKVAGSWNVHRLTRDLPLRFFVLFSSGASLNGSVGLANYAAANSFQDLLAHDRRRQGLPALSVNWGAWRNVGMAAAVGAQRELQWQLEGIRQMAPESALQALGAAITGTDAGQVAIVDVDWPRFLGQHGQGTFEPFLQLFNATDGPASSPPIASHLAVELESLPVAERERRLRAFVRAQIADLLDLDPNTEIDLDTGFFELGFDSLLSLVLRNRLQLAIGCDLPATLTFTFPRVRSLVEHLAERLGSGARSSSIAQPAAAFVDPLAGRVELPALTAEAVDIANASPEELDAFFMRTLARLQERPDED